MPTTSSGAISWIITISTESISLDEEDNKETIQIPLIDDLVFDESLALRPPKKSKPKPQSKKATYSPHSDPDTIDLFGDVSADSHEDDVEGEIPDFDTTFDSILDVDPVVPEQESDNTALRDELTTELHGILETLNKPEP